ncbi:MULTISPECIES: hypothetical protein [unclassified Variovorax]|nr:MULTISPECIES: hypothetical protein [unclassified Variovorax]VTU22971.1 hypothetical protein SRS16CHR_03158 [Variovorax sp. SRS16]VTU31191.1 hypothetical protein E5CHR_03166 [Variovorax sp. PBL-E5]
MNTKPTLHQRLRHAGWLAAAAIVLAGVFALYTRPAFMVTLIDQFWACF